MKLIDIHWGWITPGVGQANRRRQLDLYMDILDTRAAEGKSADRFYFTQPGWLLDIDQAEEVRRITTTSPEKGKADGPMRLEQLERFRVAIRRGQLVYVAYPYSGAVVEGMTGEAVLKALRLSRAIAAEQFGVAPEAFFVHDGPFQLDWNAPMIPQIARLAGFTHIFGKHLAVIESPDGTRLPMLGQPRIGNDLLYTGTEAPHLPVHMDELCERFGGLTCATATEVEALLADPALPVVSSEAIRTKGWYGGAPLVMQQQASLRRTDLTLTILGFNQALRGVAADLTDLWKRSLVLQDCHLQWLLADVAAHYLPLARELEVETWGILASLGSGLATAPILNPEPRNLPPPHSLTQDMDVECSTLDVRCSPPSLAFNPLPHRRSGVLQVGDRFVACADVNPASTAPVLPDEASRVRATPTSLENNRIRVELGPAGEIISVRDPRGTVLYSGRANQVRHWINRPADGGFLLRNMSVWEESFSGALRLEAEVEIPADGTYPLFLDVVRGLGVAVAANGDDWVRVTNAHWGGGLPSGNQEHGYSQTCDLKLRRGRNSIVLYAVADEGFKLRGAVLRLNGHFAEMQYWHGNKVLEWAADPFQVERVEVREQGARATVEFHGRFSTCTAVLKVSLDHDSERVDAELCRTYAERVYEGLQTPPLPPEVGSYLGSYCERPYVPAFTVEHETWRGSTAYSSDKPFGFARAEDSDRAWTTGRFRGLYEGMAPFLGIFTGIAESSAGSLAMLTDGHGHFFRRRPRHDEFETLGLSLGSSIIHPMTQNYRMPRNSYWEKIGRVAGGVDYDDAHERFDFIRPAGDIVCAWSLLFSRRNSLARIACHEQLLNRIFPPIPTTGERQGGFRIIGKDIAMVGMESGGGSTVIRLLNFAAAERRFKVLLPWNPEEVRVGGEMKADDLEIGRKSFSGRIPPHALREFIIAGYPSHPSHPSHPTGHVRRGEV